MNVTFREVQYIRRVWWVMLLVGGIAALMWWGFWQQIILGQPWGNNPAPDWMMWLLWLFIGLGMPLFFWIMKLIVEVRPDGVSIRFYPLTRRLIPYDQIAQVTPREYSPIKEYGGWGIRGIPSKSQKMAYNVSGKEGVELVLGDGRTVMLGSQKAQELALAIDLQMQA
ncbi:MAG TPA: hypothetical protein EYH05_06255 [Anaerolineae bacterium]|nr:hypothetical protein [Anaerolineae bacterium]